MLSDRCGRVRALQITVVWFSLFTFLSAFAQNFEQLLALKALQGVGFGGEWTAGAMLLSETMRAEHRGKAMGIVQSAWGFGWAGAVLLYTLVFSLVSPDWAWRLLFAIGVIPAGLVLYLRRNVAEPPRAVTPIASSKQALPAARSIFDRSVIFFEAVETIEEIQRLSAGESGRTRARCADTGCSSSTTTIAS
jgi:MFS family permease